MKEACLGNRGSFTCRPNKNEQTSSQAESCSFHSIYRRYSEELGGLKYAYWMYLEVLSSLAPASLESDPAYPYSTEYAGRRCTAYYTGTDYSP